jgi:hypothetical protein
LEAPEGGLVAVGSKLGIMVGPLLGVIVGNALGPLWQHSTGDEQPRFGGKPSQHPHVLKFPFNELGGPQISFSFSPGGAKHTTMFLPPHDASHVSPSGVGVSVRNIVGCSDGAVD